MISITAAKQHELPEVSAFYKTCGYPRGFAQADLILVARHEGSLVGVVRICSEKGVIVMRGMEVIPDFQRQGIGTLLLRECMSRLGESDCYCIPWSHLEDFYATGGFKRIAPVDAPEFLARRFSSYSADELHVVLMHRTGQ